MRKIYTIRYEVEVASDSPEHAAMVARDIMLDTSERLHFDVHEMEYWDCDHGGPDEWVPIEDRGWYAGFDYGGVKPNICFEWITKRFD